MGNRRISPDLKKCAVELELLGWDMEDVADILGVSSKSVKRWRDNMMDHGTLDRPHRRPPGPPRKLSSVILPQLLDLLREAPSLYLVEMSEWLAIIHDVKVSVPTIHRILKDVDFSWKVLTHHARQRDEVQRAAFRKSMEIFAPQQLVFLDESSKDGRTFWRTHGWSAHGERPVEVAPHDRGERWSILPALTIKGYIAMRVVPGSVDSTEFYDFVLNDLVRGLCYLHFEAC
jgi:transposase